MHPNEALARRELELLEARDDAALAELYTDDVVAHYPGRNPLSGEHQTYRAFLGKAMDLMGEGGTITRELHDAFGSDEHAMRLLTVTASTRGRSHSWQAAVVKHVRDGRIAEVFISVRNQHALDEFLNSLRKPS